MSDKKYFEETRESTHPQLIRSLKHTEGVNVMDSKLPTVVHGLTD